MVVWQPPLFYNWDLDERPFFNRVTGIMRSTMMLGGLISFYGVWTRIDTFRLVGSQSGSLFWNDGDMRERVLDGPMLPARVYLDSGSPNDNMQVTQEMAAALAGRGYDHRHLLEPNGRHEWPFWAGRFDELLEFLYP